MNRIMSTENPNVRRMLRLASNELSTREQANRSPKELLIGDDESNAGETCAGQTTLPASSSATSVAMPASLLKPESERSYRVSNDQSSSTRRESNKMLAVPQKGRVWGKQIQDTQGSKHLVPCGLLLPTQ